MPLVASFRETASREGAPGPILGTLAAVGLIRYFSGAIIAHLRVDSRDIVFLATAAAVPVLGMLGHGAWRRGPGYPAPSRAGQGGPTP